MKQALSGPDAERWKASMEKELTIEKMGVWRHPTFQRKNFRYHVSLSISSNFRKTDVYRNGNLAFARLETYQKNESTMSQMS